MATIKHFDVPTDDIERAKKFYSDLFDWEFFSPGGFPDFYLIKTKDLEGNEGIGGGMGKRGAPDQRINNFITVASVDEHMKKVVDAGGKVVTEKMSVPGFGSMAVCLDTEGNTFGLWEDNK